MTVFPAFYEIKLRVSSKFHYCTPTFLSNQCISPTISDRTAEGIFKTGGALISITSKQKFCDYRLNDTLKKSIGLKARYASEWKGLRKCFPLGLYLTGSEKKIRAE